MSNYRTCPMCECTTKGTMVHFSSGAVVCDMCRASLTARGAGWCNACLQVKPAEEVYKSRCDACMKATRHARYLANRERIRAAALAYRERNRDRLRERYRRYRQENPDRVRASRSKTYAKHGEKIREAVRQRRTQEEYVARQNARRLERREHINAMRRKRFHARKLAILRQIRAAGLDQTTKEG